MPEPTTYTPAYSFSGWQGSNPSKPLPATSLDAELAAIAAAITSIAAAVADVRRSDGALPNGEVTLDSLAQEVRLLIQGGQEGVLVGQLDSSAFASQEQAAAGSANDKIMTPLRVKQALDALRAFASQGEAETGSEAAKVLSPLSGKQQLDALRAFASQAEAEAGTAADKVLSPQSGKYLIDKFLKVLKVTQTLTWSSIAAGASQTQTVTVNGTQAGDPVVYGIATGLEDGLVPFAWASATHTVSIRLRNITASPIDPADVPWQFKVFRF